MYRGERHERERESSHRERGVRGWDITSRGNLSSAFNRSETVELSLGVLAGTSDFTETLAGSGSVDSQCFSLSFLSPFLLFNVLDTELKQQLVLENQSWARDNQFIKIQSRLGLDDTTIWYWYRDVCMVVQFYNISDVLNDSSDLRLEAADLDWLVLNSDFLFFPCWFVYDASPVW